MMSRQAPPPSLWRADKPLLLASRSGARQALLRGAGIPFEVMAADVDERAIEARLLAAAAPPGERAMALAGAKALAIANLRPGRTVVGADQILALGTEGLHKPVDRAAAARQLTLLSDKTHVLQAGVAVAMDGRILFEATAAARMSMRPLSPAFIEAYLGLMGEAAFANVGSYEFEGLGIQLFGEVDGDYATILGMPLLPLLAFLRSQEWLLA
jgi:septum formation protein